MPVFLNSFLVEATHTLPTGNEGTTAVLGAQAGSEEATCPPAERRAVTKLTPFGTVITKTHPDSPRKIDVAVAAVIAHDRAQWHAANTHSEPPMFVAFV